MTTTITTANNRTAIIIILATITSSTASTTTITTIGYYDYHLHYCFYWYHCYDYAAYFFDHWFKALPTTTIFNIVVDRRTPPLAYKVCKTKPTLFGRKGSVYRSSQNASRWSKITCVCSLRSVLHLCEPCALLPTGCFGLVVALDPRIT